MQLHETGEFELIDQWQHLLRRARHPKVLLGIGDDAACLNDLTKPVFSCDALVEGIHFRCDWISSRQLGWKAMAVNISDMAAMGAAPVAATASLGLPEDTASEWVEELYVGFADAAAAFHFEVAGGDTTRANQIMISVAIIGELIGDNALRRDKARAGDVLLLTGNVGDSAAGLAVLKSGQILESANAAVRYCIERHFCPTPRVREIRAALGEAGADVHAAIDISDGITGDAAHIAKRSQLDLEIDVAQIAISPECREVAQSLKIDPMQWALAGGEDYELLIAVAPEKVDNVVAAVCANTGAPVHRIGHCVATSESPQVRLHREGHIIHAAGSWRHF